MSLSPTTLSALYWRETGHVVGALSLTGAGPVTDVAALTGRVLPLGVGVAGALPLAVALPADRLGAVAADEEPGALAEPLSYGVETAEGRARPTLVRLTRWTGGITLAHDGITVRLPQPVLAATTVVALVGDAQETLSARGVIGEGRTSLTLPLSVDDGAYGVLVLAAGWAGRLHREELTTRAPGP
ncbi:hypothetical protein ABT354_12855 [Streptomyces sp. NPDC000594]|uniref:hypothetical protein n=1 Tax=Streptomyces sp. NPDC000594 TaxID=3154261 RepID=UPI00331852B6